MQYSHSIFVILSILASSVDATTTGAFRVREPPESLCPMAGDGKVGYYDFDKNTKHLFFWLAESRGDPENDPVVLWMSGGPGASSVGIGLFEELGPCLIKGPGKARGNEFAWNSNANVLFVDQPVRVGYSYSDNPVIGLDEATEDMYQFLSAFVKEFPRYADQDFYIVGESFGGSWVPALARAIDHKQSSPIANIVRSTSSFSEDVGWINLKGIGLGNAQLSQSLQWPGFFATGCTGDKSIFNSSVCASLETGIPECSTLLSLSSGDYNVSNPVLEYCRKQSVNLIFAAGLNPYDFRRRCNASDPVDCFPEQEWIAGLLNSSEARSSLGIPEKVQLNLINMEVNEGFIKTGATALDPIHWVEELLDKNYRVLIYAGNKDWFCNVEGERQMANSIRWKHQSGFQALIEGNWIVQGQEAGTFKSYKGLTFAEVFEAGHMVPADQPERGLYLINSWLNGTLH